MSGIGSVGVQGDVGPRHRHPPAVLEVAGGLGGAEYERAVGGVAAVEAGIDHAHAPFLLTLRQGQVGQQRTAADGQHQKAADAHDDHRQGAPPEVDLARALAPVREVTLVASPVGGSEVRRGCGQGAVASDSGQAWEKTSTSSHPARSSLARQGRKPKQACASSVRPSRASISSSFTFRACRLSTSEAA